MDLMNCWHCKKSVDHDNDDCFFWCDDDCKTAQRQGEQERRIAQMRDHDPEPIPAVCRGGIGAVTITNRVSTVRASGKKVRKKRVEKGPRKCGKCGGSGHNARTCNGKGK